MARSNTEGRIMARPTVMTPETIDKLRQAFLIGATNAEAAHYAGITEKTIYNYMDRNPEFIQQIEGWKNEPILKAKRKVVTDLDKDTNTAKWYLERKAADFKNKSEVEMSVTPTQKLLEAFGLTKDGKLADDIEQELKEGGYGKDNADVSPTSENNS